MISNWGKCGAIWSGSSGGREGGVSPVRTVSVFRFNDIRQLGQRPAGASSLMGVPHCGHWREAWLLMPVTYRTPGGCYMTDASSLPGQNAGQIAQFGFQVRV